MSSSLDE